MENQLLEIINEMLEEKGKELLVTLEQTISLRNDLEFDSLNLAEFTVKVEDEFDVDIFEDGFVDLISEVLEKIKKG